MPSPSSPTATNVCKVQEWLDNYGGDKWLPTRKAKLAIKQHGLILTSCDLSKSADHEFTHDYIKKKHAKVLAIIDRRRWCPARNSCRYNKWSYGDNCNCCHTICGCVELNKEDFLAYLNDIDIYYQHLQVKSQYSHELFDSLDVKATLSAYERERRYHQRGRQTQQRKKEINAQFKMAVAEGRVPPPPRSPQTNKSKIGKALRFTIDQEEIDDARRQADSRDYETLLF